MTLATNRNLLLGVVVLSGLAFLATLGLWIEARGTAARTTRLEHRVERLGGDDLPALRAALARLRTDLAALEAGIGKARDRLDALAGVPDALEAGTSRTDALAASLARAREDLTGLGSRCARLLDGYVALAATAQHLEDALATLRRRTRTLEQRPCPKPDPPPATRPASSSDGS